jgi:hypothetical protein
VRETSLRHARERHRVLATAVGVTVELELPAVRGECHAEGNHVTLRTRHAGLSCETRHRGAVTWQNEKGQGQQIQGATADGWGKALERGRWSAAWITPCFCYVISRS